MTQARLADARLEALIIEGLTSGEEIPLAQEFWTELRHDADKILARHRQPETARKKRGTSTFGQRRGNLFPCL